MTSSQLPIAQRHYEIVITRSEFIPGVDVIEIPGAGYWASEESAREALAKLKRGECPMTHETEPGFDPVACPVCGRMEQTAE
ncbi:hypothetical protein [Planobispora takensis]|uniref:Uncharacterized protein n=1 Tax=Planobispora takensis TaxID=1367882 RepID=A0A8J3STC5_9ACTN|nr:hypothetical protein [Planobispora takensis]GIH99180.1 hypothetical protein Pta02_11890 [Planobispora takensis]